MKEFELIEKYFAPLTQSEPPLLAPGDDGALIEVPAGRQLVVTTDTCIEGIHFLPTDPPQRIAQKALRINLSDLAAMGAIPLGYSLSLSLPPHVDESWLEQFSFGLGQDQQEYNIALIGGDTTTAPNVVSITITALGHIKPGMTLLRSSAQSGDRIYVTGTLGDAALGLCILQGQHNKLNDSIKHKFVERYQMPQPR